jgi:putative cardiolipin synthase
MDALIGRMALALSAGTSLDLQYYIWHNDNSGKLLMSAILAAADRGVRVRLLLDEIHGDDVEKPLRSLCEHPMIEVRLFNPFHNRSWKNLDFLTRFSEANRRMHNKAFIADNVAAVVGGRNIGDEYFEASKDLDFGDFDIVVFGDVVTDVSKSFDLYWNHRMAVPIEITYGKENSFPSLEDLRKELTAHRHEVEATPYAEALKESAFLTNLRERKLKTFWGTAVAIADSPQKISDDNVAPKDLLIHQFAEAMGRAEKEVFIVSPYFVPGKRGVEQVEAAIKRGVKVKILTNSLASNDVSVVHAGYKSYRKALLKAGAELYELKPSLNTGPKGKKKKMFSSRSGLHGKVYFFDNQRIFVGSMNLDPRSFYLNSELGLVIDSPALIQDLLDDVQDRISETTYRLFLNEDGNLRWESFTKGQKFIYSKEPETSWWQRFKNSIITPFVREDLL